MKYGYTDECQACTQFASGMPHDDRFRDRQMASSWHRTMTRDKLSVCLVTVHPEVEIPRPEAGEEMASGCGTQFSNQFPQFEWVDHRVQEPELDQLQEQMKRTQMIVKRNVSDSQRAEARRGKAKTWKNWQRGAEEQHLDADVEVPAHKTWRVEDVVGDAADAAPEQMNSAEQDRSVREDRRVTQTTLHGRRSQRLTRSWSCAYSRMS